MDKAFAIKLLAGTITRGLMWIAAFAATKYGVESLDEPTAVNVGVFVAGIVVAAVSLWWSSRKNKILLQQIPDR